MKSEEPLFLAAQGGDPLDHDLNVTAQVFLAPESHVEDRTAWIEMDKFLWWFKPGENTLRGARTSRR